MLEDQSKVFESIREMWDRHVKRYDKWYRTFERVVEHYVDWERARKGADCLEFRMPSCYR